MTTKRLYIPESERLYEIIGKQQRIKELELEVSNLINLINKQANEICKLKDKLNKIRELTRP